LGVRTYAEHIDTFVNNEFNSVYLYESIYALNDFSPNPEEVSGVLRLDAAAALSLFERKTDGSTPSVCFRKRESACRRRRSV
jgi:hypothetical protein